MEYIVVYIHDGKEKKEVIVLKEKTYVSATQAFNKFWQQVKSKKINKKNASVKRIISL